MGENRVYSTYILQCSDGSYYVGSTDDLPRRVRMHNAGKGPTWTASRLPVRLVYQEVHQARSEAVRRERQIKKWSRAKKEALISGDMERLKRLSKKKRRKVGIVGTGK